MSGYEERLNENKIKQLITTQVPIVITIMQAPSDLPHHSLQGQVSILSQEVPWVILLHLCLKMIRKNLSSSSGLIRAQNGL